jgi:hypothetical protein
MAVRPVGFASDRLINYPAVPRLHKDFPSDRKRGYDAEVLGFVETKEGKVTRFEMVVKGQFLGDTAETRGAPNGKHPLAIAFSLVSGREETDKIPPAMIFEEGYRR